MEITFRRLTLPDTSDTFRLVVAFPLANPPVFADNARQWVTAADRPVELPTPRGGMAKRGVSPVAIANLSATADATRCRIAAAPASTRGAAERPERFRIPVPRPGSRFAGKVTIGPGTKGQGREGTRDSAAARISLSGARKLAADAQHRSSQRVDRAGGAKAKRDRQKRPTHTLRASPSST